MSFVDLLEIPSMVTDKWLNILYFNASGKKHLENTGFGEIKSLSQLPAFKGVNRVHGAKLSRFEIRLPMDASVRLVIKPLRFKGLFLCTFQDNSEISTQSTANKIFAPLSQIVHDMRTPLASMIGFTRLLATQDLSGEERTVFLQRAEDNLVYLESIISEMLLFAKNKNDLPVFERHIVESKKCLENFCKNLEVIARGRGLMFSYHIGPEIPAHIAIDAKGVRHVVDNLVSNAIKYTEKGEIEVSFQYLSERKKLILTVRDTGIGIARENQEKIFAPFFQELRREQSGVGLGLAIIKMYCHGMGGDVRLVQSKKGKGSVFEAQFDCSIAGIFDDLSRGQGKQTQFPETSGVHLDGCRVLVVDDSPDIGLLVSRVLQDKGALVTSLISPVEALSQIRLQLPDILITDMHMPEMEGGEFLETARSLGFNGQAIALTGDATLKARDSGPFRFACYLTKPFKFEVLCSVVNELWAGKASEIHLSAS